MNCCVYYSIYIYSNNYTMSTHDEYFLLELVCTDYRCQSALYVILYIRFKKEKQKEENATTLESVLCPHSESSISSYEP